MSLAALAVIPSTLGDVLGNTAAFVGIYGFNEAHTTEGPHSVARVAVALNDFAGMDADGDGPDIRLWDDYGNFLGMEADPGHIKAGNFKDIHIDQKGSTAQPTYALISANNNAICIAYLLLTWPDNQNYGWVGNWGHTCGQPWYASGIIIDGKSVECTWIDANGDQPITGVQMHISEFNDKGQNYSKTPDPYCEHEPTMNFRTEKDPHTVVFYNPPLDIAPITGTDKRDSTKRPRGKHVKRSLAPTVVKSNLTTHTAASLCASESSVGPDFLTLADGQFCDMGTKTLWPVCKSAQDTGCFDNETDEIRTVEQIGTSEERVINVARNYTKVIEWGV